MSAQDQLARPSRARHESSSLAYRPVHVSHEMSESKERVRWYTSRLPCPTSTDKVLSNYVPGMNE